MNIESRSENGVAIVSLDGRFDAHHANMIKSQLTHIIEGDTGQLVINLGGVNFIASAGLAVLVQAMKRCREANGELRLCNLQISVVVILEMSGLDKALALHNSESEAIAAFAPEVEAA